MRKKINTKIWKYYENNNFVYPEEHINSIKNIKFENDTLGVTFSGGGTRSASCTIGYLKGLEEIGLLDKIKYISSVSGGAWTSIPFTFLPKNYDDETFYGKYLPPELLSKKEIDNINPQSFQSTISKSSLLKGYLENALKLSGDETYSRAIGKVFLKPYNLDNKHKFFTHDLQTLQEALNINLKLYKKNFYLARNNRPFLIVSGTILDHEFLKDSKKYQIEFTPYYTGIRKYHNSNEPIGGGYINTYSYDSKEPNDKEVNLEKVEVSLGGHFGKVNEFALSDMMGSTGAAPQEITDKLGVRYLGFPEFRHWSIIPNESGVYRDENEFSHGDGGHLENLGVMPLFSRKVKNIIVFVNSKTPFKYNDREPLSSELAKSIKTLFMPVPDYFNSELKFKNNIILSGGKNKYLKIIDGFNSRMKSGKALIFQDTYDVLDNDFYDINSYEKVNITWVYNHLVEEWKNKLHKDFKDKIGRLGDFKNFPNYKTFFENFPFIVDLNLSQVGLLSNMCHSIIIEEQENIRSFYKQNNH